MDPTLDTWIYATASVLFISAAPALILVILPIDHRVESQLHLKKLLALAAGCLLGDAFLHLIPHSRSEDHDDHGHSHSNDHHDHHHDHHDHHEHHDHLDHGHEHHHDMSGLKILGGMMVFLIMEKFIYSIKRDSKHDHSSHHSNAASKKKNDDHKSSKKSSPSDKGIHVTGWLNLAADFLHNFTDGLAIGASFLAGKQSGIGTSLAIFLHEVPHEISDYAILVQSGCTKKKAIWLQLLTAIGACAGTMISLYLGTLGDAKTWILPFTAGGFIYIATVHILPQLKSGSFKQTVSELLCIVGGVALMYFMASFE